jgi:single-stranded DNA-binding protein
MPTLVVVTGFIDSDVQHKTVGQDSKKVAEFSVNDGRGWVRCVAWQEQADAVPAKGTQLIVHGRLQTRSYEKDGSKRYVTEVVVDQIGTFESSAVPAGTDDLIPD